MYAMKTFCEWNPAREAIAWTTGDARIGCNEPAAVLLGRHGEWHLCEGCASLAVFAHFRERSLLATLLYSTPQPSNTRAAEAPQGRETRLPRARHDILPKRTPRP
jgi:hypothetical protein